MLPSVDLSYFQWQILAQSEGVEDDTPSKQDPEKSDIAILKSHNIDFKTKMVRRDI